MGANVSKGDGGYSYVKVGVYPAEIWPVLLHKTVIGFSVGRVRISNQRPNLFLVNLGKLAYGW